MKKLIIYLLLALLAMLSSCEIKYQEILSPLQYIPAACHCRYKVMAKHFYITQLSKLQQQGLPAIAAQDSATRRTHRLIAETQLHLIQHPKAMANFCDCYEVNNVNNYATPSIFDEDIRRIDARRKN